MTEIEEFERWQRVCASDYDELQAQLYACQVRLAAAEQMAKYISEHVGDLEPLQGCACVDCAGIRALARFRSTQPEQQHKEQTHE